MNSPSNADFALVVEELAELVRAGDESGCEALIARHPGFALELRELLATLATLASWKSEVTREQPDEGDSSLDRRLGDYSLIREIGRGGMGIVYEAQQISLDRRVAVKVLPMAAFLSDRQLRRFKNEARAAAALQHPNIVSVHGVGCERSVHFYAMELIDGPNLANVIAAVHRSEIAPASSTDETSPAATLSTQRNSDAPSFYRAVAKLGVATAQALDAAHQEGIIHRDIKPANLLMDRRGQIHVADFGLARFSAGEDLTFTGDQLGTLRYMSPEQVESDPSVNHRTDIYSLGVTLYELLSGVPAFTEDQRLKLTKAIVEQEPPKLERIDPRIPTDLATIVSKAMAKEPSQRYSNAKDLADDLQRFIQGRTVKARPATWLTRASRFARRNPSVTALLAISTILFALLSAVTAVTALGLAQLNQEEVARNDAQAKEIARQRQQAYGRNMLRVQRLISDGDLVTAEAMLRDEFPANGEVDLRNIEWAHHWRQCHPDWLLARMRHGMFSTDATFSSDGKLIAEATFASGTIVWDWAGKADAHGEVLQLQTDEVGTHRIHSLNDTGLFLAGNVKAGIEFRDWKTFERVGTKVKLYPVTEGEVHINSIDADPLNTKLAIGTEHYRRGAGSRLSVRTIDGTRVLFEKEFDDVVAARFIDSSKLIYAVKGRAELTLMSVVDFEVLKRVELDGELDDMLHLDKSRSRIAFTLSKAGNGEQVRWLEVRDAQDLEEVVFRIRLGQAAVRRSSISGTGRYVAAGDDDGEVWIGDTQTRRVARHKFHPRPVTAVTFSPDESVMACSGIEGITYVVDLQGFFNESKFLFESNSVFLSDSEICTAASNRGVELWSIENGPTGKATWDFGSRNGTSCLLKFVPQRNLVVAAGVSWPPTDIPNETFVAIWDRTNKRQVAKFPIPNEMPTPDMPMTPDGRYLAVARGKELTVVDLETFAVTRTKLPQPIFCTAISGDGSTIVVAAYMHIYFLDFQDLCVDQDRISFDSIRQHRKSINNPTRTSYWDYHDIDFIPGSNEFAVVCYDNRIKVFDGVTGEHLHESQVFPEGLGYLSVSPDGKRLGVTSGNGYFRILANPGFEELATFEIAPGFQFASFSPSGNLLMMPRNDEFSLFGDVSGELLSRSRQELTRPFRYRNAWNSRKLPSIAKSVQNVQSRLRQADGSDWTRIVTAVADLDGDGVVTDDELEKGIRWGRKGVDGSRETLDKTHDK